MELTKVPAKNPVVPLVVQKDLLKIIDNYRFDNHIGSRNEAIRRLIVESLKRHGYIEKKNK